MGARSQRKGNRVEREIVRQLQEAGFAAEKVSGMYKPGEDISVPLLGIDRRVEVKARAAGFKQLYGWLEKGKDILALKANHKPVLYVVPARLAIEIAQAAERSKSK